MLCACMVLLCGACNPTEESGEEEMTEKISIEPLQERDNVREALCGTDALGRQILPAGETNGKLVGIFYLLWLGNDYSDEGDPYFEGIYDMSKMDFADIYSGSGSPFLKMHFYAEPLFGYYNMQDYWVVERHVQMFIAAGMDFLAVDATNNNIYKEPLSVLLEILETYRAAGYKVPKIMFMTNTRSYERVQQLYDFLYKDGRYRELWFCDTDEGRNAEGKPWITMRTDEMVYLPKAVRETFYIRASQWPNEPFKDNGFPWIEFTRPQPVHNGVISVSVAQNAGMHMSDSVQYEESPNGIDYYNKNWGRGYTSADKNSKDRVAEGANFQEQWNVALASDARIVILTEWNEWSALKLATEVEGVGNTVVFFDCATPEFSRDIEPISGFYGDNFYMQMIRNMRLFKGEQGDGIAVEEAELSASSILGAWSGVTSGVADFAGKKTRSFINSDGSDVYMNDSKRNDITEIRVAEDAENVYLLLTAAEDITKPSDANWMNVWLKTQSGTEGYDYVINKSRSENYAFIERLGDSVQKVGDARTLVSGKYMQLCIPKEAIGNAPSFELKVTDNVDFSSDVMLLYTQGDSAPYGRLNYKFILKES